MSDARFAVVQFAPELEPAANLARLTALAVEAAANGATCVVFPEYTSSFTPKLDEAVLERAQPLDGPFTTAVQQLARETALTIVFGLVETSQDQTKFANAVVAVGSEGDLLAVYRKAHLFDAFGHSESSRVVPGKLERPPIFEHRGLIVGLQTCYDLRFPEQSRWLIDADADVLVVPAEWVAGEHKVHHWRTLVTARAIENTAYVVAADHPEPIGVGNSMIVDPLGRVIAERVAGEGIASAEVTKSGVAVARDQNPSLKLRRFGVSPI